jgi:hypothetical protein
VPFLSKGGYPSYGFSPMPRSESVTNCNRLELEEKTGKRVVSGENYLPPKPIKKLGGK